MDSSNLNRRDFGKLTAAAFGGALAGAALTGQAWAAEKKTGEGDELLLQEPHVCRGLNTCKGKDKTGKNECPGKGACATAEKHGCKGENECKGLGGCGEQAGVNSCKGKGSCEVPLSDKTWPKARARFEKAYEKKFGKKPGPAPAA